ncbi:MAG: hypothetical protein K8R59_15720 [Thermoanaerobaculales bacterium]|nr:hypothetical protein [Thermoanaerobaculales bacterium]
MKFRTYEIVFLISLLGLCVGCSGESTVDLGPGESTETITTPLPAGSEIVTGTVVETMDAASYTYVRVDLGSEEIWAASSQFEVAVGDRVSVPLEMPMADFRSETLDRVFPTIYFASRILREGEDMSGAMPSSHPPMEAHGRQVAPVVDIEGVKTAEGGVTVAQVWTDRSVLAGKTVTVAGQVVKFNGGILGTNWLHIQDGSGSAEGGTNDLTVTSAQGAAIGDIVTVTGTLAVDQDFGAGYTYAVMIKDATLAAQE